MITLEKLKVFEKYKGDDDRFTRASKNDLAILSEDEFYSIQRLISDLKLIVNGIAAVNFEAQVLEQINILIDNDMTKDYLLKLSKTLK